MKVTRLVLCVAAIATINLSALGSTVSKMKNFESRHVPGEFIVHFQEGLSQEDQASFLQDHGMQAIHYFTSSEAALVRVQSTTRSFLARSASIASQPEVALIEANMVFKPFVQPNDPDAGRQYGSDRIDLPGAWEITKGSKNVTIAVVDTGVNYNHPDLAANYWHNAGEMGVDASGKDKSKNNKDDDNNGYVDDFKGYDFASHDNDPMDEHGHGTHCWGIIGAVGNNGVGVVGVNWTTSIVGLRFIGANGEGTTAAAVEAIEYATKMGFNFINASWGGDAEDETPEDTLLLSKAIDAYGKTGALFIAAAGNDGRDIDEKPTYPASYELDSIITVGSTDRFDLKSIFSNVGKKSTDLFAPGSLIYSTFKDGYSALSGTSMAAPYVTGAAAMVKANEPSLTGAEIKARLLGSVDKKSILGKSVTGGRLNLRRALENDMNN